MAKLVTEVRLWGAQVGAVQWSDRYNVGEFEYSPDFIDMGVELAPFKMPLKRTVYRFPNENRETFHGLPGMLADSLPDRYGHRLFDQWLTEQGRAPSSATPLELLMYVGERGMGALTYHGPKSLTERDTQVEVAELVRISNAILDARDREQVTVSPELTEAEMRAMIQVGTSAGGARAKAIVAWNPDTNEVRSGQASLRDGFEHWIIKLDGIKNNRDHNDKPDLGGYCTLEYIYHKLAVACGIEMTECRLLRENGRQHFMTRRFDRPTPTTRLMQQTLCALGHYDYNVAGGTSYDQLFACMKRLNLGRSELEQQYRRLVFNVIGCNRDDHTKNISFLMDRTGTWSLSPAYDMTFAYKADSKWVNGHQMTINGKRDNVTEEDLLAVAKRAGVPARTARRIFEEVFDAFHALPALCEEYDLSPDLARPTIEMVEGLRTAVFASS